MIFSHRNVVSVIALWLAGLVLLGSCQAIAAGKVEFKDLNEQDEVLLKAAVPGLNSDSVNLATLDEAIRWLMKKGSYENAFVEKLGGTYTIIGKPLRTVQGIKFVGVKEIREKDLENLIEFKIGDRFDRKKAVNAAEKMKNFYGESGYFNTVIELNFEKTASKDVKLVFNITEKQPCRIKALVFSTPNIDLKDLLDRKFKSFNNKPLTTDRINKLMSDLQELLIENRYLSTDVLGPDAKYNLSKTEAYLQIEVREPQKWEFYFDGNQAFTTLDIYKALDLENKERKNVDPASEGSERLRRAYLEKGFPNVQIETRIAALPDSYLRRVYYTINEGPRVRIGSIQVEGRISRSSRYYQDFILENSSSLVADGFYVRAALDNGFKNMETELRNQGFLRARILSSRIEYNSKKDMVTVYLILEEGPQTQIRGLDFLGNKFFSSFELAEVTGLQANSPLRLNAFEASLEKLKSFYRSQGFMEMKLLNEGEDIIQYNDKGTQARITFQIYEGPRIRVHSIVVEGNSMTKTKVILNEADLELGEVLTPEKRDDAITRLNRLGLFSRVDIRTLEEGTTVSERTIVISVSERDPGAFVFGGGVTNERKLTLRGYTGMSYNNLLGTARAVSGRVEVQSNVAEINFPETEVTVGYLEPFLFNTRTRGRVNLTRSEYVFDYRKEEFKFTEIVVKNRIDFLLERDLTTHTKLTYKLWSWEFRRDRERYGRGLPCETADKFDPQNSCPSTELQIATIGPQLDIDYRDNPFLPTRGSFTRTSLNYSSPNFGSTEGVEFIKAEAEHRFYQRLASPRWVWANSVRGGYLQNLSKQNREDRGIPTDQAFILGGIYSLRGFDISQSHDRVPRDDPKNSAGDTSHSGFVLGTANEKFIKDKSSFYLFKTELRFPLYGDSFGGVLFYDGGLVHVDNYHFQRAYRDAVGIGIRFNTPVGPAAFDVAWKINPIASELAPDGTVLRRGEDHIRYYLYIGTF